MLADDTHNTPTNITPTCSDLTHSEAFFLTPLLASAVGPAVYLLLRDWADRTLGGSRCPPPVCVEAEVCTVSRSRVSRGTRHGSPAGLT